MKIILFFNLIIICCITYIQATNDKCERAISYYSDCALDLILKKKKYARTYCSTEGKCVDVDKFEECFDKIFSNYTLINDIYYASSYDSIHTAGPALNFVCTNVNNVWCYDLYKNSTSENGKADDFYCSECGKTVLSKYKSLLEAIGDNNPEEYKNIKEVVDKIEECPKNGSITNIIPRAINILLIFIGIMFLIH